MASSSNAGRHRNFEHMPELTWTWGYPLCLAVVGVICGYVYWRFKRSGWL
jgi:magnesium transporter